MNALDRDSSPSSQGSLSIGDIQVLIQAAQSHCPCVVRVPANETVYIKQTLDTGVDGVFIGPNDFSASMGKPGAVDDANVREKIETVRQACLKRGMPLGIFGADAAAVKPYMEKGFRIMEHRPESCSL